MAKNPNPARMNRTTTQVLPRTEPNMKVKNVQEPEPNLTEPQPKCHGSYSVLSLNEIVGIFIHFTVNEEFYFT